AFFKIPFKFKSFALNAPADCFNSHRVNLCETVLNGPTALSKFLLINFVNDLFFNFCHSFLNAKHLNESIRVSREILQVVENIQNVFCVKFLTCSIEDSHGMSLAALQRKSRTLFALLSTSYELWTLQVSPYPRVSWADFCIMCMKSKRVRRSAF